MAGRVRWAAALLGCAVSLFVGSQAVAGPALATGDNQFGQLGDGTTTDRTSPVAVLNLNDIVAVAAGGHHSLAVSHDGTVWAWGRNGYGQLGDGTNTNKKSPVQVVGLSGVVAIAAGSEPSGHGGTTPGVR